MPRFVGGPAFWSTWVQGLGYLEIIKGVLVASNQQLRVTSYLSYTPSWMELRLLDSSEADFVRPRGS
jgi:hypothetical protein